MNNTDKENLLFLKKLQQFKYDIEKANLEDIDIILKHYNQVSFDVDGITYHYNIDPLYAACLNEKYKELTGQNHPVFIKEHEKVLDKLIKAKEGFIINGKPTIYQRLKNNLTGKGLGISILPSKKGSYIEKFEQIRFDMSKASLEDVKDILDNYDQDSVLINGIQHHFRPNALQAASLNARYRELTGQNHPIFEKVQNKILNEEIKNGQGISVNGNPTIYEQLKNNTIEIGGKNHIINKTSRILLNPEEATLEEISALLNYYNGKPVLINGVATHPFNEPVAAAKLNARYCELTGENHPVFMEQVPKVIDSLMKDKDMLISVGAYDVSYFEKLEHIKQQVYIFKELENKQDLIEENGKSR